MKFYLYLKTPHEDSLARNITLGTYLVDIEENVLYAKY